MSPWHALHALLRHAPLIIAAGAVAAAVVAATATTNHAAFAADNDAAMTRMMTGMGVESSGDIDRDFAAMMIPHHQGAIDMAQAELRHGSSEQLRRIAQEIIVAGASGRPVQVQALQGPPRQFAGVASGLDQLSISTGVSNK